MNADLPEGGNKTAKKDLKNFIKFQLKTKL